MISWKKILGLALVATQILTAMEIGAWVGGSGEYPQPTSENVEAFETLQNRHLDIISEFVIWDNNDWSWTKQYADVAEANGSILLITWMPNGYTGQNIVDGKADAYIRKYASDVKAYGKKIWLRPLHEANGDWYSWGIGQGIAGNTNASLIAAWKHIVQIFRDSSVTNVKWAWTTNASNSGPGTSIMGAYPGDEWVDYNSIDGYNWGNNYSWSSWKSFEQTFGPSYDLLAQKGKPIFIAEFSSTENGGSKAQWITDMFSVLPSRFPKIFALMWFSQSKSAEADWGLNTSATAVEAWKSGISKYTTRIQQATQKFIPNQPTNSFDLLGRMEIGVSKPNRDLMR